MTMAWTHAPIISANMEVIYGNVPWQVSITAMLDIRCYEPNINFPIYKYVQLVSDPTEHVKHTHKFQPGLQRHSLQSVSHIYREDPTSSEFYDGSIQVLFVINSQSISGVLKAKFRHNYHCNLSWVQR